MRWRYFRTKCDIRGSPPQPSINSVLVLESACVSCPSGYRSRNLVSSEFNIRSTVSRSERLRHSTDTSGDRTGILQPGTRITPEESYVRRRLRFQEDQPGGPRTRWGPRPFPCCKLQTLTRADVTSPGRCIRGLTCCLNHSYLVCRKHLNQGCELVGLPASPAN